MSNLRAWALARLGENSTLAGLMAAASTIGGWHLAPEYGAAIATIASLLASAIAIATKERRS